MIYLTELEKKAGELREEAAGMTLEELEEYDGEIPYEFENSLNAMPTGYKDRKDKSGEREF